MGPNCFTTRASSEPWEGNAGDRIGGKDPVLKVGDRGAVVGVEPIGKRSVERRSGGLLCRGRVVVAPCDDHVGDGTRIQVVGDFLESLEIESSESRHRPGVEEEHCAGESEDLIDRQIGGHVVVEDGKQPRSGLEVEGLHVGDGRLDQQALG